MDTNNTYFAPISPKKTTTRQDEKWDEAVVLFNSKQYDKVLPTLLAYIDSALLTQNVGETYIIPHGSVVVEITQTENELSIKCPFLNIQNAKKTPLMRRFAELRMQPLNLTNIALDQGLAYFSFSCPLNLCEPYKVYGVLREICYYADSLDDEFIEKFDAVHIQEPKITPLAPDLKLEAYVNYQNILDEGIKRFDHYMSKRHSNNAWYTLNITFKRLEFYSEPQGYLRTLIEKAIDSIFNRNISFSERLLKGKENMESLKNYDQEKFSNDLYQVETFVPHKYTGKKENIRENWEAPYEDAQEMISNNNYEDAANIIQSCFYNLFYYNLVDELIMNPITSAMAQANGLSYSQAAPILLKGMEAIMEDNVFANDFGMDLSKIMGEQMQESMAMMQKMMSNIKMN